MAAAAADEEVGRDEAALILALSLTAGWVDCVCYIALFHVFVANMTGNTIASGIGLGQQRWSILFRRGLAIPMFVLGLLASRLWMHWARARVGRASRYAYAAEAVVLAGFILLGRNHVGATGEVVGSGPLLYYVLVALPSFAMGLQNATLSHFGPVSIRTTHISGTLAHFADECATLLLWARRRCRERDRARFWPQMAKHSSFRLGATYLSAWLSYLAGATLGALAILRWRLDSLWAPVGFLLAICALAAEPSPPPKR